MQASQAMNESSTLVSSTSFDALLDSYLQTSLRCSLSELRKQTLLVPEEMRLRAWHLLSYALRTGKAWQETREILTTLAPKMEQAGFREEWIAYLASGVEVGAQHNDTAATAEFALQIATLLRMLSEYDRAVQWLDTSLAAFRQAQDRHGEARALNELAWIEQLRRRYDDASQHVEQALALLDDDDPERGMCYRTQGMIAHYQEKWIEAEDHHRRSLIVFEKQENLRKVAWAKQNLGLALRGQQRYAAAIERFLEVATTLAQLGDDYHWSITQISLGLTYYQNAEIDQSIYCYLQAESTARKLNDRFQLADICLNLGLAYMAKQAHELASQSFRSAIGLYSEVGVLSLAVNSMDGLAMSYMAQALYDQALGVIEDALALLPEIKTAPLYAYCKQSLEQHWQEATAGQAKTTILHGDIV